jgi:hypothetical protein
MSKKRQRRSDSAGNADSDSGASGKRFFISYSHKDSTSKLLSEELHRGLSRAGHFVFIDSKMLIGTPWEVEIKNQHDDQR